MFSLSRNLGNSNNFFILDFISTNYNFTFKNLDLMVTKVTLQVL